MPAGGFKLGGGVCATGVLAVLTLMLAKRADKGFCSSPAITLSSITLSELIDFTLCIVSCMSLSSKDQADPLFITPI